MYVFLLVIICGDITHLFVWGLTDVFIFQISLCSSGLIGVLCFASLGIPCAMEQN